MVQTSFAGSKDIWLSNFGISPRLRCKLPLNKGHYVFGRPENLLPERATLALVAELCRDCTDFLDVGANEGLFTFWAESKGCPDLRLHWFEPDRTLYSRLKENLAHNSIPAMGSHVAISAQSGTEIFFKNLSDDSSGSLTNLFTSTHETITEQVNTISLAEYLRNHRIRKAMVKVDVEGAGQAVWEGACEAGLTLHYLIMEMIAPEIDCGLPARIISEGNFYAYYIHDLDLIASYDGTYQYAPPFMNWLFCRLDPESLRARLVGTRFRVVDDGTRGMSNDVVIRAEGHDKK